MNKIAIIGSPGSGKSTIANKIGAKLDRPVIHLDKEYWVNGKERFTKEEWVAYLKKMISTDQWIIDGNYQSTLEIRLNAADTIVYVDAPRWLCLWRVFSRLSKFRTNKLRGNRNTIDWKLVNFIIKYPRERNLDLLKKYGDKDIYILRNKIDLDNLIERLDV